MDFEHTTGLLGDTTNLFLAAQTLEDDKEDSDCDLSSDTDSSTDDEREEVEIVAPLLQMWSLAQIQVLAPKKDAYFHANPKEQKVIVNALVEELNKLEPQDKNKLKIKVTKWMQKRVGKRTQYGITKKPTLADIYAYYHEAKITQLVIKNHGVMPGDKGKFVGLWRHEICLHVADIRKDRKELAKYKAHQEDWMMNGVPRQKQRQ